MLGLHVRGRALVRLDRTREAMDSFDEAIVAIVVDDLSPIVVGTVYCSALAACQEVLEWGRAHEWTEALTAWCGTQPDAVAYSGRCLVHRAELLQLHGAWPEAAEEARRAGERLASAGDSHAAGAACYGEAEAQRLLGNLGAAEEAYRRAGRLGFEPHPGLALLRLAQGQTDAAAAAIDRVTGETADRLGRARLLPAQVEIMLAAGDVPRARAAADELAVIADGYGTPALAAVAGYARGAVLLAEGDARAAVRPLREAWHAWQDLGARYEAARVRTLLGLGCRALGDDEAAAMELEAARDELRGPRGCHRRRARRARCPTCCREVAWADAARAGGAPPARRRQDESHDRRRAGAGVQDRRPAREQHLRQARRVLPCRGHRRRVSRPAPLAATG